jgi:outer membrane protein TolC
MRPPRLFPPRFPRARFFAVAGLVTLGVTAALRAQTAPAADEPLLQPWVDYTLPAPGQPLPNSEAQLDQLLAGAAAQSPTMLEQADLVDEADASRFRSWMRHMPVLTASYSVGLFGETNVSGSSSALTPGGSLAVQATEPLWHWGAFDAQTNAGLLAEQIAQNEAVLNYAKLCLAVRESYYKLIVLKAQADTYEQEIPAAQHILDQQRLLYSLGHATEKEVNDAQVALSNLKNNQDQAATDLTGNLNDFRRVTGSRTFGAEDVPGQVYLPVKEDTGVRSQYADAQTDGLDRSLLAREAELNEKSVDQQLIISSASRKPQFDLAASISQSPYINSANNGLKFGTIFFLGVTGTWTLFDRGESVAQDNKLRAQKRQIETQFTDTREQNLNDAANSLNQMDRGLRALATLRDQLQQQQDDYRRAQTLIGLGHAGQTDLDTARNALLETRLQLLTQQAKIAENYYSFLSDIFRDPALAHAPPFTQPR